MVGVCGSWSLCSRATEESGMGTKLFRFLLINYINNFKKFIHGRSSHESVQRTVSLFQGNICPNNKRKRKSMLFKCSFPWLYCRLLALSLSTASCSFCFCSGNFFFFFNSWYNILFAHDVAFLFRKHKTVFHSCKVTAVLRLTQKQIQSYSLFKWRLKFYVAING